MLPGSTCHFYSLYSNPLLFRKILFITRSFSAPSNTTGW
jgi:hypothetical protein